MKAEWVSLINEKFIIVQKKNSNGAFSILLYCTSEVAFNGY